MYYVEEIINGVLMYKTSPNGEWKPVEIGRILSRMKKAEAKVSILKSCVRECMSTIKWLQSQLPSFETEIRGEIDHTLESVTRQTENLV
jgi:hypothetical protein